MTLQPSEIAASSFLKEPWRAMTLPGLARGAAVLRPESKVVSDSANASVLMGRPARTLTAETLDREAALLGRKLRALGLKPGETIVVQLPNTVEAAIGILGVLMAGAVPALLQVFETGDRVIEAARSVSAAGILTVTHFAGLALAESARGAAAAVETIRFIAAVGQRAPAGVAALDGWNTVEFIGPLPATALKATNNALITFDSIGGAMRPFVRSHEHLVAEASNAAARAQIASGGRIIATLQPATTAGIVFGLVTPLLVGAMAELTALFDSCAFAAQLGKGTGTTIVLPAAAEESFESHCAGRKLRAETIVVVHRPEPGLTLSLSETAPSADRTIDSIWLGEACGLTDRRRPRLDLSASPRYAGDIFETPEPPLSLVVAEGDLVAQGPMAPRLLDGPAGHAPTGFPGRWLAVPVATDIRDAEAHAA